MAPWVTVCHLGRWSSSVWWPCGFLSPATGLHQPPPPLSTLTPIRLLLFAVIEYILKCIFTLWTAFCISRLVSSGSKTKDNLGFPEMKPAFIAFFFFYNSGAQNTTKCYCSNVILWAKTQNNFWGYGALQCVIPLKLSLHGHCNVFC